MIYFGDVDAVIKLASCGFLPLLPELLGQSPDRLEIRYLPCLRSRITRASKRLKEAEYHGHLVDFCASHPFLDRSCNEARFQALLDGGMDPGEALLFAEAESTGGVVVTGDKRAVLLYGRLSTAAQRARIRIVCWEQLLLRVHRLHGYERLRAGCCAGIDHDKLLVLAFSSGPATPEAHALAALESYLRDLQRQSADLLMVFPTHP